jgi:hypothetical protein
MSARTKWFIGGAVIVVLVLLLIFLLLDSGDDSVSSSTSTSSSTTIASTTSAPPPSTTPVTAAPICASAEAAAQSLIDAQLANDEAAAHRCATDAAVDAMFPTSDADTTYVFQGCFDEPLRCAYTYEGGSVSFVMGGSDATGWRVESAEFSAD